MTDEHAVRPMTRRQRDVYALLVQFRRATGESPSVAYLARRLRLHHSVVQQHLDGLFRRGWLLSPTPDGLRCLHDEAIRECSAPS